MNSRTQTLRIIAICSGNICRSPMAQAILTHKLDEASIPAVVISAGTLNINGRPAATNARVAMTQIGLDIDGHRSQGISLGLLTMADYLVIMAPEHRDALLRIAPRVYPKIIDLWKFSSRPIDADGINDPVGQNTETFVQCRDSIIHCIDNWLATL